jgi:uncharacterized protein with ATP-grasp and redox domains
MKHAGVPINEQPEILYSLMDTIKGLDTGKSPCFNSTHTILKTYDLSGCKDPFIGEKKESNKKAMELLKVFEHSINYSDLHSLFVLSSAGNIIDSGIMFDYDIEKTMAETLQSRFSIDHFGIFRSKLKNAVSILYIGDNCGEIVFDMPAVRFLSELGKDVYYAVKSAPILNDALKEDAEFAGINRYATIIETGSGFLGVNPDDSSGEFMELLNGADLVISKGQANFESLDEYPAIENRIFFILKIKCESIADVIPGSRYGDSVFYTVGGEV